MESDPHSAEPANAPEETAPEASGESAPAAETPAQLELPTNDSPGADAPEASAKVDESAPEEQTSETPTTGEAASGEAEVNSTAAVEGEGGPVDPLTDLANRAQKGRLSAADEEQAAKLLTAALQDGREGLARAVEQLPRLPWIIGVNGVTAAWPEMKPAVRNRLLASLARVDSDAARRVRLSLARGLFKLEPTVAAKLAVGVAKEIRDKETGAISAKNAQVFANVLIGRAKPWLAQLPLAEMKPTEADLLVHCALMAVFTVPHTPVTQLGVIKWAAAAGKLGKLQKSATEIIIKGLGRWSGKWQGVLRREVEGLPEEIVASLRPEQPAAPEGEQREERRGGRDRRGRGQKPEPAEGDPDPEEESALPEGERPPATDADADSDADEEDEDDEEEEDEEEEEGKAPEPAAPKPRPVYESKTVPPRDRERDPRDRDRDRDRRSGGGDFNLNNHLRQIESYVSSLRAELNQAQNKLRQRDDDSRKNRKGDRQSAPIIPGEPSAEELARLNVQLEARNAELQQRIEELTADSEDRAAAAELHTEAPVADEDKRLRQLLVLKLQESYDDFLALESESPDIVAPKHYRTVLGHVFQVLAAEGIFTAAPAVD
jgi:hypothetical protein